MQSLIEIVLSADKERLRLLADVRKPRLDIGNAVRVGCGVRFGEKGREALLAVLERELPPVDASNRAIALVRTSELFTVP